MNNNNNYNKWMITPFQPNWDAIYSELNKNGMTNLQDLPDWVTKQMKNVPHSRLGPIDGDSPMFKHWLSNTTVGDMLKVSEDMGIDLDPWTDVERKVGRRLPKGEMPLNGSNIDSQLKGLTVGDMINYSKDVGIDIPDLIPDDQRIGVEYAKKDRSIIKDHDALIREKRHLEHINSLKNTYSSNTPKMNAPTLPIIDPSSQINTNNSRYELKDRLNDARIRDERLANEAAQRAANETLEESAEQVAKKNLKKSTLKNLGHVGNAGFAIMDYKDSREAGNGVVKSVAKAGIEFAKGELLGGWYVGAMLAKSVPTLAISAIEGVNTMSRSMNSIQRRQVFGDSQFMDTQQLATMRQSGMELAKMSQYNLQQAMMGNEAEYMHRL